MSLEAAVAAIVADLQPLLDRGAIPAQPGEQLNTYPMFVVYPNLGETTFDAHDDGAGHAIYRNADTIVIEWHAQPSDYAKGIAQATVIVDQIRKALLTGFMADSFDGAVDQVSTMRLDTFGELNWGSDQTFGVRMLLDLVTRDTTN